MKEKQPEILYQSFSKAKNRRVLVEVYQYPGAEKLIRVATKRLESFSDREIIETNNCYTIDSVKLICNSILMVIEALDSEITEQVNMKIYNNL